MAGPVVARFFFVSFVPLSVFVVALFFTCFAGFAFNRFAYSRNPAIVAVMKFASVPANIARRPSRARS
jgi:hypothetical protein